MTSKDNRERLLQLRKQGDEGKVKLPPDPLPPGALLHYGEFLLSYVREQSVLGEQRVLAISRLDLKEFTLSSIPPEVFEVFSVGLIHFQSRYPGRGPTRLFVVDKNSGQGNLGLTNPNRVEANDLPTNLR